MGFADLVGKAKGALNSDKGEKMSDKGLDKASEFAEGKGLDADKVDQGREFADGKIGGGDNESEGEQQS